MGVFREMNLDHLDYLRDRPYRRRLHAQLRRLANAPGLNQLTVIHEPNDECCAIEPWPITFGRIIGATNADGIRTAGVLLLP